MVEYKNLSDFCKSVGIPVSKVKKVYMPEWWVQSKRKVIGYSDWVDTRCCALYPSVFVWVPAYDYSGYFQKKDLKLVKKDVIQR
jgi:hypothetical protein